MRAKETALIAFIGGWAIGYYFGAEAWKKKCEDIMLTLAAAGY